MVSLVLEGIGMSISAPGSRAGSRPSRILPEPKLPSLGPFLPLTPIGRWPYTLFLAWLGKWKTMQLVVAERLVQPKYIVFHPLIIHDETTFFFCREYSLQSQSGRHSRSSGGRSHKCRCLCEFATWEIVRLDTARRLFHT